LGKLPSEHSKSLENFWNRVKTGSATAYDIFRHVRLVAVCGLMLALSMDAVWKYSMVQGFSWSESFLNLSAASPKHIATVPTDPQTIECNFCPSVLDNLGIATIKVLQHERPDGHGTKSTNPALNRKKS
jgi:hypothetical protein